MAYRYPSTSSISSAHSHDQDNDHDRYDRHHHHHDHSHGRGRYTSTPNLSSSSSQSHNQSYGRYASTTSVSSGYGLSPGSGQRPSSFCSDYGSGYGSGYTSPGYMSPVLSPTTFRYAQSPPPTPYSPCSPAAMKLFDINCNPHEQTEFEQNVEFHQAPDTFPCGHVLCHHCLRKFIKSLGGPAGIRAARCPVCRMEVSGEDVSLASVGLPSDQQQEQEAPISLLSNFDEIVKKFNGIQHGLRRLKDESVQSRSMGMTYTNTVCHLCHQSHPTLRVIQEHNHLEVRHERPAAWRSQYFYRLQQGKVVTTFYSKVNAATICVPCTYRELREAKAILPPEVHQALPDVDPGQNQQVALAEVGKIMAKNTAPLMVLKGKNVIEVDHKIRVRERADRFQFTDTAGQVERMVRQQEEDLLRHATKQIRDTGQLYHVQESNEVEVDNDETIV
ncbi:uncharacterized protein LOC143297927 [Babylonia areolata]|uniref:uncharacterized protein LOC143297927 n=1 Tax=Babylonia areolata TaxID=304850 RepID=UPI003FD606CE